MLLPLSRIANARACGEMIAWAKARRQSTLSLPPYTQQRLISLDRAVHAAGAYDSAHENAIVFLQEVVSQGALQSFRAHQYCNLADLSCNIREDVLKILVDGKIIIHEAAADGVQVFVRSR